MSVLAFLCLVISAPAAESVLVEPSIGLLPQTPRSIAMGGAQIAIADGADGLYANPAGMGVKRHYVIELGYGWHQLGGAHRGQFTVIDSQTSAVAAGVGYQFEKRTLSGDMDIHRVYLGTAYQLSIVTLGITTKYQNVRRHHYERLRETTDDPNVDPTSLPARSNITPAPNEDFSGFTMDAGVMLNLIPQFSLGVVGYNLIPALPKSRELAPLGVGVGAALHIAGFELDADAVIDFQSLEKTAMRWHFGAEYTLFDLVPLRAGFVYDQIGSDLFWSAGAGFNIPQFGVEVGYRNAITNGNNRALSVSIKIGIQ